MHAPDLDVGSPHCGYPTTSSTSSSDLGLEKAFYDPETGHIVATDSSEWIPIDVQAGRHFHCMIGDRFGEDTDDHYQVTHMCGIGGSSTVFAAENLRPWSVRRSTLRDASRRDVPLMELRSSEDIPRWVALKFTRIEKRGDVPTEEALLRRAAAARSEGEPDAEAIVPIFDAFDVEREDGNIFRCLVEELLGGSFDSFLRYWQGPASEPARMFQTMMRGLNYVHSQGFAHGDIDRKNIALTAPAAQEMGKMEMYSMLEPFPATMGSIRVVRRRDREPLPVGVPHLAMQPTPFNAATMERGHPPVKMVDFGEAFDKPVKRGVHAHNRSRAPEAFAKDEVTAKSDIWAAGLILASIIYRGDIMVSFADESDRWLPHVHRKGQEGYASLTSQQRRDRVHDLLMKPWLQPHWFREDDPGHRSACRVADLVWEMLNPEPDQRPSAAEVLAEFDSIITAIRSDGHLPEPHEEGMAGHPHVTLPTGTPGRLTKPPDCGAIPSPVLEPA